MAKSLISKIIIGIISEWVKIKVMGVAFKIWVVEDSKDGLACGEDKSSGGDEVSFADFIGFKRVLKVVEGIFDKDVDIVFGEEDDSDRSYVFVWSHQSRFCHGAESTIDERIIEGNGV